METSGNHGSDEHQDYSDERIDERVLLTAMEDGTLDGTFEIVVRDEDEDDDDDYPYVALVDDSDMAADFGEYGEQAERVGHMIGTLSGVFGDIENPNIMRRIAEQAAFSKTLEIATGGDLDEAKIERIDKILELHTDNRPVEERIFSQLERFDPEVGPEIDYFNFDPDFVADQLLEGSGPNLWHLRYDMEPWESDKIAFISLIIDAHPQTGSCNTSALIGFRNEGIAFTRGLDEMLSQLTIREAMQYYPFFDELGTNGANDKRYRVDPAGNGRYTRYPESDMEVLMQMSNDGISVTMRPTKEYIAQQPELDADEATANLKESVQTQLEFTMNEAPKILSVLMQAVDYGERLIPSPEQRQKFSLLPIIDFLDPEQWLMGRISSRYTTAQPLKEAVSEGRPDNFKENMAILGHNQRMMTLYKNMLRPLPDKTLDMVSGIDHIVDRVRDIIYDINNPELNESLGLKTNHTIFLEGPTGVGKTMVAEAAAKELGGLFFKVTGTSLLESYAGETEKNISGLFEMIRLLGESGQKIVVQIDEIEGVAPNRDNQGMMEWQRTQTTEFLNALQGDFPNAIIFASTNKPDKVDPAVIRSERFNLKLEVKPPETAEARKNILDIWRNKINNEAKNRVLDDIDMLVLGEATDGWTGADLKNLISWSIEEAKIIAKANGGKIQPLTTEQALQVVEKFKKGSVNKTDVPTGNYL